MANGGGGEGGALNRSVTRRQWLRGTAASAVGLLALAACGGASGGGSAAASPAGSGSAAGNLPLVRLPFSKGDFDIGVSSDAAGVDIGYNLFEGLVSMDKDGATLRPGVAEKWEAADDGLTWTFHLRKDAKFSDGAPITAQTFVDSWKRVADPKTAALQAGQLYLIKGFQEANAGKAPVDSIAIKAVDDYTFQATTTVRAAFFPLYLATTYVTFAQPMHIISKVGKAWADPKNYVSNGPFRMAGYKPDQELLLEPNPFYWGEKPKVRVALEVLGAIKYGNAQGLSAYEGGQLDMAFVPFSDLDRAKKDATLSKELVNIPNSYVWWINVDVTNPPLNDKRVRQALYLAIDRDKLTQDVLKGAFEPFYGVLPPTVKVGYTPDARIKGTVEDARRLLAEAGFPGGQGFRELELSGYSDQTDRKAVYQALQAMWKDNLGINIRLNLMDSKPLIDLRAANRNKPYDINDGGWLPDYDDPYNCFNVLFAKDADKNWPKYRSNAQFEDLITRGAGEQDVAKRTDLYTQAHKILVDDAAVLPYARVIDWELRKPNLQGLVVTPEKRNYRLAWTTSTTQK
jgi:oligopeptide transport system substrate-binding protein